MIDPCKLIFKYRCGMSLVNHNPEIFTKKYFDHPRDFFTISKVLHQMSHFSQLKSKSSMLIGLFPRKKLLSPTSPSTYAFFLLQPEKEIRSSERKKIQVEIQVTKMEIETVGQLQVYLLLKKADLLEYFTKCKSNRILWFLPLPGGHFNFMLSPVFLSGHLQTNQGSVDASCS